MARKASFSDLQVQTYDFEIVTPDGESLLVTLRALSPAERARLDVEGDARPTPPITNFQKDGDRVLPVYEFQNATYQQQMDAWLLRRQQRLLIASLVEPTIPGETDGERMEALGGVASWVMAGLWRALETLLSAGVENVKHRPFHGASGGGDEPVRAEGLDGEPIPEPVGA